MLVVHEPRRAGIVNSSWAFLLEGDGERTRLLSRWCFRRRGAPHRLFKALVFDPAHFVMETGVLHGLKRRAERRPVASEVGAADVGSPPRRSRERERASRAEVAPGT